MNYFYVKGFDTVEITKITNMLCNKNLPIFAFFLVLLYIKIFSKTNYTNVYLCVKVNL